MEDTEEPVRQQKRRDFDSYFKRFVEKPCQAWLDPLTPHTIKRWVVTVVLTVLFDLRIFCFKKRCPNNNYCWLCFASKVIAWSKHAVFTTSHPSPLSVHRGFLGCGHFSKVNLWLKQKGYDEINWLV